MRAIAVLTLAFVVTGQAAAQHTHSAPAASAPNPELDQQIETVRRATERYREHANSVADGYKLFGAEGPLMGEHWYHPDLVKKPLDLAHPATLQYATIAGRRTLVGVAYNVYQRPGEALPDGFAGSTDHWHVHDVPKLARALVAGRPVLRWIVDRRAEQGKVGAGNHRSQLVMVHAWIWSDNPDGMFAQQQRTLPYLRAGLPVDWAGRGDLESAAGISLLRDGCAHEVGRLDRLARLSAGQKQELSAACADAASQVRSAAADARSADLLNDLARHAWNGFTQRRAALLSTQQKRRLDSVVEPMHPISH